MSQPITVLVVNNEPSSAELVAEMLERERDVFVVGSTGDASHPARGSVGVATDRVVPLDPVLFPATT